MVGDSPDVDGNGSGDSGELAVDAVFDAMADQLRRHVIRCLPEEGHAVGLSELAWAVAEVEAAESGTDIAPETVTDIETSLYHLHVPKLEAAGVVEYDQDRNLVRVSTGADQFDRAASLADSGTSRDGT